jgi:8-oxo-dGTP diphosphatase
MTNKKLSAEGSELNDDASNYDDTVYKNPSVTADLVILSVIEEELGVLLIKRKHAPFKDHFALPGGFVNYDEDIETAAYRELKEETGVDDAYLEQLYTFGKVNRDPRKRIITVAYFSLVDYKKIKTPVAGDDAKEAKWFKLSELPKLAFDHDKIIDKALDRIRNKISYTNIGFELIPDTFTIPELRKVFEMVLGREINPTNFRTKILKLKILKKTKEKRIEGKGQPAPVYALDDKKFARLKNGETLFN